VLLLVAIVGCAVTHPLTPAQQAQLDHETHLDDLPSGQATREDAVVRVIAHGGFCSGAVIGDALVVTAGHCLEDLTAGYVYVELGQDALPWGRVGARDVMVCQGWHGGYEHDVGFVVLNKRLPSDVPRLGVREGRREEVAAVGAKFVARGFGTAMLTTNIPDFGDTWSTHAVARSGGLEWSTTEAFAVELRSSSGDSGGPVIAEGTRDVVGVTSQRSEGADAPGFTVAARISACRGTLWQAQEVASRI
jgi:trypsin